MYLANSKTSALLSTFLGDVTSEASGVFVPLSSLSLVTNPIQEAGSVCVLVSLPMWPHVTQLVERCSVPQTLLLLFFLILPIEYEPRMSIIFFSLQTEKEPTLCLRSGSLGFLWRIHSWLPVNVDAVMGQAGDDRLKIDPRPKLPLFILRLPGLQT